MRGLLRRQQSFDRIWCFREAKHRRMKAGAAILWKETLEMGMAALLEQENLLLAGPKATGKNVLAENLAYIFGDRCITCLSM